jgi:hypothetical protein
MALHPPRTKLGQRIYVWSLVIFTLAASAMFIFALPKRYSPVAPIDLEDHSGPFAQQKLASLRTNKSQCLIAIARSKLVAKPAPEKHEGKSCGYDNALNIEQSFYPYTEEPLLVSCPMAAALYVWEREVVSRAATRHLGSAVVRIEMFGAYSCRRRNGASEGPMSEHAYANAIDISGFTLANGKKIMVEKVWKTNTPEAAFLREVRDGACNRFQVVLSPDYNRAHYNHLHLDMGAYKMCR